MHAAPCRAVKAVQLRGLQLLPEETDQAVGANEGRGGVMWEGNTIKAGLRRKAKGKRHPSTGLHQCWIKGEVSCLLRSNGNKNKVMDTEILESPLREQNFEREAEPFGLSHKGYCGGKLEVPRLSLQAKCLMTGIHIRVGHDLQAPGDCSLGWNNVFYL